MNKGLILVTATLSLLAGCVTTPPPKVAQEKTVEFEGRQLAFGGQYDEKKNELDLSVNGDAVMKGRFPPFTPTLNLNANYSDLNIGSHCYFGSVLGRSGGSFGTVAGIIQAHKAKSADKCDISVNGKVVESLWF